MTNLAQIALFLRILSGLKMTDQIGRRKQESFSFIEVLSVVAVILVVVMVAVPFPYASRNQGLPASRTALARGSTVADTSSSDTLKRPDGGKTASGGYASQGSPFEVRTVGQREFCADMPGVVRFSTTGGRCKNGTLVTNSQPHREQPRP